MAHLAFNLSEGIAHWEPNDRIVRMAHRFGGTSLYFIRPSRVGAEWVAPVTPSGRSLNWR